MQDFRSHCGLCYFGSSDQGLVAAGEHWYRWIHKSWEDDEQLPWGPALAEGSSLRVPPFTWCVVGEEVLLAGIDHSGHARCSRVPIAVNSIPPMSHASSTGDERFCAVAIIRPGLLAGVHKLKHISWFRAQGNKLVHCAPPTATPNIGGPVACFANPLTSEVLVVCRDGHLARVLVPAGI